MNKQQLTIDIDSDSPKNMSDQDSISSPPSNTWLAILPSQDLIPTRFVGTHLPIPVSQIYAQNQSREFTSQNFSFDQVKTFTDQVKAVTDHLTHNLKSLSASESELKSENKKIKERNLYLEEQINIEKLKYNNMIKEGKTRIHSLSTDNQTTKKDLEILKDNNNFKDLTINSLSSQLQNLTLSCTNTKIDAYQEFIDDKKRYEKNIQDLSMEKQNLLLQNEQIIQENINMKQNLDNVPNQIGSLNENIFRLKSENDKLQETLNKKDETIEANSKLIYITEDKLRNEKQLKNDIQNKFDKISSEQEHLLNENTHLKNSNESLRGQSQNFEIFSSEKTQLQNQISELKSENSILKSQIQELETAQKFQKNKRAKSKSPKSKPLSKGQFFGEGIFSRGYIDTLENKDTATEENTQQNNTNTNSKDNIKKLMMEILDEENLQQKFKGWKTRRDSRGSSHSQNSNSNTQFQTRSSHHSDSEYNTDQLTPHSPKSQQSQNKNSCRRKSQDSYGDDFSDSQRHPPARRDINKDLRIPPFYGGPNNNVDYWILKVKQIQKSNNCSDAAITNQALCKINGEALEYIHNDPFNNTPRTLEELRKILKKINGQCLSVEVLQGKFDSMKIGRDEDINTYNIRFARILKQFQESTSEKLSRHYVVRTYIDSLPIELSSAILQDRPKTIEKAYEKALQQEYLYKYKRTREGKESPDRHETNKKYPYKKYQNKEYHKPKYFDESYRQKQNSRYYDKKVNDSRQNNKPRYNENSNYKRENNFSNKTRRPSQEQTWRPKYSNDLHCNYCKKPGHIAQECKQKITCSFCNIKGHTSQECRQKQSSQWSPKSKNFNNNKRFNDLTCNYCQNKGHTWKYCKTRMRDNENQNNQKK